MDQMKPGRNDSPMQWEHVGYSRRGLAIFPTINKLPSTRIENALTSLESILASIALQINPPAGFACCWKQQPMMLEDAYGMFVPIPLDIVTTWQVRNPQQCLFALDK